jgi:hypothetical protein
VAVLRHLVVFRIRSAADADEVVRRLEALSEFKGLLHWKVRRSLDERKGVVILQDSTFRTAEDLEEFRVWGPHASCSAFMAERADWVVVDYVEDLESEDTECVRRKGRTISS